MLKMIEDVTKILEKDLKNYMQEVINAGTINPDQIKTLKDASKVMINFKELKAMCEEEEMGNSYGNSYSYRQTRSPMTGRYISRGDMSYNGPYETPMYGHMPSYDMHYSSHSIDDRMIDALERMMGEATSDYERQRIQEKINQMRMSK